MKKEILKNTTRFLLLLTLMFGAVGGAGAAQTDILGPAGSGRFGENVVVLPNGNIVVVDSLYDEGATDIGAVYLYNGATLALISTLKGSSINDNIGKGSFGVQDGVIVLANGNFVVRSPAWDNGAGAANAGAVTFCSAVTGCNGTISSGNSLIGGTAGDEVGYNQGGFRAILTLPNGSYVVSTPAWDNGAAADAGAVTFCSGTTGCANLITQTNSLVGGSANDVVGAYLTFGAVALTNGNYVVGSQFWDNPTGAIADVGAVTWCSGTTGCAGLVTSVNSLVGGSAGDNVGLGLTILSNGNYVVGSPVWSNPAGPILAVGAVTWGNGAGGTVGLVTVGNSLFGGTEGDQIGFNGVVALTNGNYVAVSPVWDNPAGPITDVGAITWGNGTGGTVGLITTGNSLIGGTTDDLFPDFLHVTALTNGNYVVQTSVWDNPTGPILDVGAVTWGNGATGGTVGLITPSNSLVGGTADDQVSGGSIVTVLSNGNYVVNNYLWDNPAGPIVDVAAVTWGNGMGGTVGLVTPSNSLVGGTANDRVGSHGIFALTNGNYVVQSMMWDNPAGPITDVGAVTWGNGMSGIVGLVSASNSLVGTTPVDPLYNYGVTPLTNGNYVVNFPGWDNGAATDVGAVIWGNGAGGTIGAITPTNSLIGGTAFDNIGGPVDGITALSNGNYLVNSRAWHHPLHNPLATGVGAVTWGNGASGTTGVVTICNSLYGGTSGDGVGTTASNSGVMALPNGNYVVQSNRWDNPIGNIFNARAATLGNGASGTTGLVSSVNSVPGMITNDIANFPGFAYDAIRNRLVVGRVTSNIVSVFFYNTTTAVADGDLNSAANWDNGVPTSQVHVVIPTGRSIIVNSPATIGSLDIASGGTLVMNANLDLTGALSLGTTIDTGANTLGLSSASAISGASATNYVIGNLKKDFACPTNGFSYPVGTANGYSPVTVNITALATNPSSLTVKANQGNRAGMHAVNSLQRFWTLTESGNLTADLTFKYNDPLDIAGTESSYNLYRFVGATGNAVTPFNLNTAANTMQTSGVTNFSDWAIGNLVPTAASVSVSGRILVSEGRGLRNARVTLTDSSGNSRTALSGTFGYYQFENVEVGQTYIFTVFSKRFRFTPQVVTMIEEMENLNFTAEP